MKLQGPCAKLLKAGCDGKWTSNIQRDMLRASATGDDAPWPWCPCFIVQNVNVWTCHMFILYIPNHV